MSDRPIPQTIYKHFKGNLYQVICVATNSETLEEQVVYQALYGDYKFYVRPLEMFMSKVDKVKYPNVKQEYRFEPVNMISKSTTPQQNTSATVKSEGVQTTNPSCEGVCDSTGKLDRDLLDFLDASTYDERLEILARMRYKITNDMIDSMSIVTSINVPEGDVAKRYEDFKEALITRKHFECNRFRRGGI